MCAKCIVYKVDSASCYATAANTHQSTVYENLIENKDHQKMCVSFTPISYHIWCSLHIHTFSHATHVDGTRCIGSHVYDPTSVHSRITSLNTKHWYIVPVCENFEHSWMIAVCMLYTYMKSVRRTKSTIHV